MTNDRGRAGEQPPLAGASALGERPAPPGRGPFAGGCRYNKFGAFLQERFGCRVHKVSVDAGFTCPNRDGTVSTGGCTFCRNNSFRPTTAGRGMPVEEQLRQGIARLRSRFRAERFLVYFQPFTNTHAPLERLAPLYESALAHPDVIGLSVGTRPDCIDEAKLRWFEEAARKYFVMVEYGLQSIYDSTLARINRGHDFRCWQDAMSRSRDRGVWLGTHLILGFPWETREQMLAMAPALSNSGLNSLKLHHLHLIRDTVMGSEYQRSPFRLMECDEYVGLVVDFLERLSPEIRMERLLGSAPRSELLAPDWTRKAAGVRRAIEDALDSRAAFQGRLWHSRSLPEAP